jgi:hypothetical protein
MLNRQVEYFISKNFSVFHNLFPYFKRSDLNKFHPGSQDKSDFQHSLYNKIFLTKPHRSNNAQYIRQVMQPIINNPVGYQLVSNITLIPVVPLLFLIY